MVALILNNEPPQLAMQQFLRTSQGDGINRCLLRKEQAKTNIFSFLTLT
jgi:hypothetical protein